MPRSEESDLITYRHVEELVVQRREGRTSDEEMMTALLSLAYAEGESEPSVFGSGYIAGSWDAVRRARQNGLLGNDEYAVLFERCPRAPRAS